MHFKSSDLQTDALRLFGNFSKKINGNSSQII